MWDRLLYWSIICTTLYQITKEEMYNFVLQVDANILKPKVTDGLLLLPDLIAKEILTSEPGGRIFNLDFELD